MRTSISMRAQDNMFVFFCLLSVGLLPNMKSSLVRATHPASLGLPTFSKERTLAPIVIPLANRREITDHFGGGTAQCGDGLQNALGEECDPGYLGAKDRCCTEKCKLRGSAKCSPAHDPCCTHDCEIASSKHFCRLSASGPQPVVGGCSAVLTFCDGIDPTTCPVGQLQNSVIDRAADLTGCADYSACSNGSCLAYCESSELSLILNGDSLPICDCSSLIKTKRNDSGVDEDNECARCCSRENRSTKTLCVAKTKVSVGGQPCVYGMCKPIGCIRVENPADFNNEVRNPDQRERRAVDVQLYGEKYWRAAFLLFYWILPLSLVVALGWFILVSIAPAWFQSIRRRILGVLARRSRTKSASRNILNKPSTSRSRHDDPEAAELIPNLRETPARASTSSSVDQEPSPHGKKPTLTPHNSH